MKRKRNGTGKKTSEEVHCRNFKWEDEEKEREEEEEEEEENGSNNSDLPTPTNVTSSVQGRRRNEPIWMRDYVSGEGLSEEEDEVQQLAMFAANDPTTFEEAAKSPTWREAMD